MNNKENMKLRDIKMEDIKPFGIINEGKRKSALEKIGILKNLIDDMTLKRDEQKVPSYLFSKINAFETALHNFILKLEEKPANTPDDAITRQKDNVLNELNNFYANSINIESSNSTKLILYHSIVTGFNNESVDSKVLMEEFHNELEKAKSESSKLIENIKSNVDSSATILNELKKKTSEQTVSDYAVVFQTEVTKHEALARRWIIVGVSLIVGFIISLIVFSETNFMETEVFKTDTGEFIRYNFTNLIAKVLIVAIQVFMISFSFKQYSINKHLKTLNQHRQNALNSYKLFTKSIVGEDSNSRNALMIQVAKAIYEHSQTTGFLNEKGQNVNSGIVELTKIIGENKPI